jgi:tRNA-specific 2-thiouridylase
MLHLPKAPKDTRVIVAMSGGVDSSTVAAMLHEQGYQVVGITLQLYDLGVTLEKKGACCAGQDIYDAKNVADKLGFPHYVLNYESLFKEAVIDEFADSYLRGETPVPCIRCNQSVKFRDLLRVAKELEGDALVTGHYVRRLPGKNGKSELHRAEDASKDQSYFLFATTQEQLDYTHFPLGDFRKEKTRQEAERFGLTVANKPDSQDICFVPNGNYASIISKLRPGAIDPGPIRHIDGRELGTHRGIIHYTLGQRRGLGIGSTDPLYVVRIDPDHNVVYVGPEEALQHHRFVIKDMNWLGDPLVEGTPLEATVRIRSAHPGAMATVRSIDATHAEVTLFSGERAITPGQACVIYEGSRVLGGGWITRKIG